MHDEDNNKELFTIIKNQKILNNKKNLNYNNTLDVIYQTIYGENRLEKIIKEFIKIVENVLKEKENDINIKNKH